MEKKKISVFKILMTILFAAAIFGSYFYIIFGEFKPPLNSTYFYFGSVALCFVFSLLFMKMQAKKVLVTLALAVTVVADFVSKRTK